MTGEPPGTSGELDPIWRDVLSAAIAAPSPLNSQPWSVGFPRQNTLDLFIDSRRLLPTLDPLSRQAHLSCGAFIENLSLAARQNGYLPDISLFPAGWPGDALVTAHPVARIELAGAGRGSADPLFSSIFCRRTCRERFTSQEVSPEIVSALAGSQDQPFVALTFATDASFREEMGGYLEQAAGYELADCGRLAERLSWIQVPGGRSRNTPDGYGVRELGLSRIQGWMARLHLALRCDLAKTRYIRTLLIGLTHRQARSAAGYGWIATKGDQRFDQVRAGRVYQRVCLTAASHGLCIQPMTTILEPYPGMEALQERFSTLLGIPGTHTVHMLFRLGYGDAGKRPLRRRPVHDLVRNP
jgi:hypothetical protein